MMRVSSILILLLLTLAKLPLHSQVFQAVDTSSIDAHATKVIPISTGYLLAGFSGDLDGQVKARLSLYDGFNTIQWSTELDTATVFQDGIYVEEENAVVLVGYQYVGPISNLNRVGLITAYSAIDGSLLYSKVLNLGRSGSLRKIIQHPNPGTSAPFFATGTFRNGEGFALDDLVIFNFDITGDINYSQRVRYVSNDSPDLQAGNDLCLLPNGNMIASGGEGPVSSNLIEFDVNGQVVTSGFANTGHFRGLQESYEGGTVFCSGNFQGNAGYLGVYNDLYELQFRINLLDVSQAFLMDTKPGAALISGYRQISADSSEMIVMEFNLVANELSLNWAKSYLLTNSDEGQIIDLSYQEDGRIAFAFNVDRLNENDRKGYFGIADAAFNSCSFETTTINTAIASNNSALGTLDFLTLDATITETTTGSNPSNPFMSHICGDGRTGVSCSTPECPASDLINISTGIDVAGNLIPVGTADPFWELMNIPPLTGSTPPSDINVPDAWAILSFQANWNTITDPSQPASQPISVRPNATLSNNNQSAQQPWRFRREFCVCETSTVVIDGLTRADNAGRLLLYSEINPLTPLSIIGGTSTDNTSGAFTTDWPLNDTLTLIPGSYHLEYELRNLSGVAMGFSLAGTVEVISGDMTLFASESSCCGAGVLSVQKIDDQNCNAERDNGEPGLPNWDFTLTNTATGQSIPATTDQFGEIIFRALPFGTYTLTETINSPWVPSNPSSGSMIITIGPDNPVQAVTFLNKNAEVCNCTSAGLTVEDTNEEDCCFDLNFSHQPEIDVFGVEILLQSGVEIDPASVQLAPGLIAANFTANSYLISDATFGPMNTQINSLISFCLSNVVVAPQIVEINYLGADFAETLCTDMLASNCPVSNPCLDLTEAELDCSEEGYALNLTLNNPDGGAFEDIGYIKINISSPASLAQVLEFEYDPAIGPDEVINIEELLLTSEDLFGQDLCIVISAHDNIEQRLCCFVDSLCIPFPLCDPCPFVDAYLEINPEDSCCYSLLIDNTVPLPNYFDSIFVEVYDGPNPTLASSQILGGPAWNGTELSVNQSFGFNPAGATSPLIGLPLLDFCVTPDFSPDSTRLRVTFFNSEEQVVCVDSVAAICELDDPCPDLDAYLEQDPEDPCCYDVYVSNNFQFDPNLITAVNVDLIGGPATSFSAVDLLPFPSGWGAPTVNNAGVSYTFNPPIPGVPSPNGVRLMEFCLEESYAIDSSQILISFQTGIDTVCTDTLAAFCPGCLTVNSDSIRCTDDGNYIYTFNFTNYSDFPVNRVVLLQSNGETGLNVESIIDLGLFVPVGSSFISSIPVDLSGVAGEEVCFDIVLRHVLPEEDLNIECCYATHCVVLPDCEDTDRFVCPESIRWAMDCPVDEIQMVCGCDGITYTNPCLAIQQGILDFFPGGCGGGNLPAVNLNGDLVDNAWAALSWNTTNSTADYWFQELQQRPLGQSNWERVQRWEGLARPAPDYRPGFPLLSATEFRVLKLVTSGQVETSNIVLLVPDQDEVTVSLLLHPNPVTSELVVQSSRPGAATLSLLNTEGQTVQEQAADFDTEGVRLNVSRQLPGVYTLVVRYADGQQGYQRFVKE